MPAEARGPSLRDLGPARLAGEGPLALLTWSVGRLRRPVRSTKARRSEAHLILGHDAYLLEQGHCGGRLAYRGGLRFGHGLVNWLL